jgi:hypothetical protein
MLATLCCIAVVLLCCRAKAKVKAKTWCRDKVAGQSWVETVAGKCDSCFKVKETATSTPATNNSSRTTPPATA